MGAIAELSSRRKARHPFLSNIEGYGGLQECRGDVRDASGASTARDSSAKDLLGAKLSPKKLMEGQ